MRDHELNDNDLQEFSTAEHKFNFKILNLLNLSFPARLYNPVKFFWAALSIMFTTSFT